MRRAAIFLAAMFVASVALTAEHDQAYYKRTATKAPMPPGEFVIGPSLHYSEQFSAGLTFGYRWHNGVQLLGDYSLMRVNAQQGVTTFHPYPICQRSFQVPYDTGNYTRGQAAVTVLFPLRHLARAAR